MLRQPKQGLGYSGEIGVLIARVKAVCAKQCFHSQ